MEEEHVSRDLVFRDDDVAEPRWQSCTALSKGKCAVRSSLRLQCTGYVSVARSTSREGGPGKWKNMVSKFPGIR